MNWFLYKCKEKELSLRNQAHRYAFTRTRVLNMQFFLGIVDSFFYLIINKNYHTRESCTIYEKTISILLTFWDIIQKTNVTSSSFPLDECNQKDKNDKQISFKFVFLLLERNHHKISFHRSFNILFLPINTTNFSHVTYDSTMKTVFCLFIKKDVRRDYRNIQSAQIWIIFFFNSFVWIIVI